MKMGSYEVEKVSDCIWSITDRMVYMYLVEGAERALLIDTGFGVDNPAELVKKLTPLPYSVLITHGHGDHISGCRCFREVFCHPADFHMLRENIDKGSPMAFPFGLKPAWEGDSFDLGGRTLEVLSLPGHTPGNIALLDRQNRMLFGGDIVQEGPVYTISQHASIEAFRASLERLDTMKKDFDIVWAAHHTKKQDPSIIIKLIGLAERIIDGTAAWKPVEVHGSPCREYYREGVSIYHK